MHRPLPTAANPDTARLWLAMLGLAAAAMVSGVSMRLADALLPRLAHDFIVPLGQAAQVITSFAAAYGLSQLAFGPLGDRYGKLRVIGRSCAASALASLGCALAPGQAALLVGRFAAGCAAGAVIPLALAWIGDVVPYAQRQPVMARFLMGQMCGAALGVWLGGLAADHLHWRTPFAWVAGGYAAVALVLAVLQQRLPMAWRAPSAAGGSVAAAAAGAAGSNAPGGSAAAGAWRALWADFASVLARPAARRVLLAAVCEGAAFYGPFAFVASHLHQRWALPLAQAGALVMLFAAGGLGFALAARWMVQRLGERQLVRWGACTVAAALLALAAAPAAWVAVPGCAALGLGFYMIHNTLQVQATQMAPDRRGAAVASFAAAFFLGQSVGVAGCALLLVAVGSAGVLAAGAVGMMAVAWGLLRTWPAARTGV